MEDEMKEVGKCDLIIFEKSFKTRQEGQGFLIESVDMKNISIQQGDINFNLYDLYTMLKESMDILAPAAKFAEKQKEVFGR